MKVVAISSKVAPVQILSSKLLLLHIAQFQTDFQSCLVHSLESKPVLETDDDPHEGKYH